MIETASEVGLRCGANRDRERDGGLQLRRAVLIYGERSELWLSPLGRGRFKKLGGVEMGVTRFGTAGSEVRVESRSDEATWLMVGITEDGARRGSSEAYSVQ